MLETYLLGVVMICLFSLGWLANQSLSRFRVTDERKHLIVAVCCFCQTVCIVCLVVIREARQLP